MPEVPNDQESDEIDAHNGHQTPCALFDHILLPGRSTGPRTPEGKQRSSQNARKHGCTSRELILPGECPEAFEALRRDWLEDFQPAAVTALELVEQTAQAHWLYLRVQKQCDAAEAGLESQNPLAWSEAQWKLRERLGRYRTTAERSFHRALGAIEARRKSRTAEFNQAERLEQAARRIELQFLRGMEQKQDLEAKRALAEERERARQAERERKAEERKEDKARKEAERAAKEAVKAEAAKQKPVSVVKKGKKQAFGVVEQWLEVRITEGVTTTAYVPENAELLDEIKEAMEKGEAEPEMVYRRMNFPDGVPSEYAWTNLHDPGQCEKTLAGVWCPLCSVHTNGGHGIQRMTFATWKQVIEREKETPGGHAGPTGSGNLPRPKERGGS